MPKNLSLLLTILMCLPATGMKCVSSGNSTSSGSGHFKVKIGPVEVEAGGDWNINGSNPNKTLAVDNKTGETMEGCIIFEDAQGNPVGTVPVQIPPHASMTTPVPPNATTFKVANGADCPEDKPSTGAPSSGISAVREQPRYQFGARDTVDLDNPNVNYWITGNSNNPTAWTQTADHLASHGYGSDFLVQQGVSNVRAFLTEITVRGGNDIEATFAHNAAFQDLELWVNDVLVMDMSQSYRPTTVGTGWEAYSFLLPANLPEFNYNPVSGSAWSNELMFRFHLVGDPKDYEVSRMAEFTSN